MCSLTCHTPTRDKKQNFGAVDISIRVQTETVILFGRHMLQCVVIVLCAPKAIYLVSTLMSICSYCKLSFGNTTKYLFLACCDVFSELFGSLNHTKATTTKKNQSISYCVQACLQSISLELSTTPYQRPLTRNPVTDTGKMMSIFLLKV